MSSVLPRPVTVVLHISYQLHLKFVYKMFWNLNILSDINSILISSFFFNQWNAALFVVLSVTVHRLGTKRADCWDEVITRCCVHEFFEVFTEGES